MKVNENLLKISAGYIVINEPLKMDETVILKVEGDVTKIEDKSNQDGTVNRVFTVKGIIGEPMRDGKQLIQNDTLEIP